MPFLGTSYLISVIQSRDRYPKHENKRGIMWDAKHQVNVQGHTFDADIWYLLGDAGDVGWVSWDESEREPRNCHVAKMVVDQRSEKLRILFEELKCDCKAV